MFLGAEECIKSKYCNLSSRNLMICGMAGLHHKYHTIRVCQRMPSWEWQGWFDRSTCLAWWPHNSVFFFALPVLPVLWSSDWCCIMTPTELQDIPQSVCETLCPSSQPIRQISISTNTYFLQMLEYQDSHIVELCLHKGLLHVRWELWEAVWVVCHADVLEHVKQYVHVWLLFAVEVN